MIGSSAARPGCPCEHKRSSPQRTLGHIEGDTSSEPLHQDIKVRILEYDARALVTKLKRDLLQDTGCGSLCSIRTHATRKEGTVDALVRHE